MAEFIDYYAILNIERTVDQSAIERAYHDLIKQYDIEQIEAERHQFSADHIAEQHTFDERITNARTQVQRIQEAYDVLSDIDARRNYDQLLIEYERDKQQSSFHSYSPQRSTQGANAWRNQNQRDNRASLRPMPLSVESQPSPNKNWRFAWLLGVCILAMIVQMLGGRLPRRPSLSSFFGQPAAQNDSPYDDYRATSAALRTRIAEISQGARVFTRTRASGQQIGTSLYNDLGPTRTQAPRNTRQPVNTRVPNATPLPTRTPTPVPTMTPDFTARDCWRDGQDYWLAGDYEQAIDSYTQAIELQSDSALYYNSRALAYWEWAQAGSMIDWSLAENALTDANRALELDPEYGRAYGLRGVIAYARWQDTGQETFRTAAYTDLTTYIDLIGDAARPDYLAIYELLNE